MRLKESHHVQETSFKQDWTLTDLNASSSTTSSQSDALIIMSTCLHEGRQTWRTPLPRIPMFWSLLFRQRKPELICLVLIGRCWWCHPAVLISLIRSSKIKHIHNTIHEEHFFWDNMFVGIVWQRAWLLLHFLYYQYNYRSTHKNITQHIANKAVLFQMFTYWK